MLRTLFFGMGGPFSTVPLQQLLSAGREVSAIIIPGRGRDRRNFPRRIETPGPLLPLLNPQAETDLISLAHEHQLPLWEVASLSDPDTLALLAGFQPEVITIACFPYIFPPALLNLPRYGCLNLHPSLLPAYRGPTPLFWIARQDESRTGVTLHLLDAGLDTGDIVAQTAFDRPEGISEADLERRCATEGAALLLKTLYDLDQGIPLPRRPQPEQGASYYSWPCDDDLVITPDWPARRAFNFLRGAAGWSPAIQLGGQTFPVRVALSYSPTQALEQPYLLLGDELWIQFQPGVLRARL